MPLYEYKCESCEHLFEKIQNFRSRAPKCPECGGRTHRQLSAPAIQFKGTGWYLTDYARKGKGGGKETPDAKPQKKDSTEKSASSGDAAPAAKPKKKSGDS